MYAHMCIHVYICTSYTNIDIPDKAKKDEIRFKERFLELQEEWNIVKN